MQMHSGIHNNGFMTMVEQEMRINQHDFFSYFPTHFYADEILFFSVAPDIFCNSHHNNDHNRLIFEVALLIYCSVKVHILTEQFKWQSTSHSLEFSVLTGDYLSGRFIEKLLDAKEYDQINDWLAYLSDINEGLATMALEEAPIETRHQFNCVSLIKQLLTFCDQPLHPEEAEAIGNAFYDGSWDRYIRSNPGLTDVQLGAVKKLAMLYAAGAHQPIEQIQALQTINRIWESL